MLPSTPCTCIVFYALFNYQPESILVLTIYQVNWKTFFSAFLQIGNNFPLWISVQFSRLYQNSLTNLNDGKCKNLNNIICMVPTLVENSFFLLSCICNTGVYLPLNYISNALIVFFFEAWHLQDQSVIIFS